MAKFLEQLTKALALYGPLSEDSCQVEQKTYLSDFKIYIRYNNSDIYQGYTPSLIPTKIDRILYGYLQYDNCLLNYDLSGQWEQFLGNSLDCTQNKYATGNSSLNIYSTDPYVDFVSWPPNSQLFYGQPNNDSWSYNIEFSGKNGLNNINKISQAFNMSLSLLFYGPNTIKQISDISNDADAVSKIEDFYNKFLPSAAISPFEDLYTRVNNNITGLDIYFSPGDHYWPNLNQTNIVNFLNFLSTVSDISKIGTSFTNATLTINASPYIAQALSAEAENNLKAVVNKIDTLILNSYDYPSFSKNNMDSTRCYSPLFFDIEQIKTPLRASQNITIFSQDYFNSVDLTSKTDLFIYNFNQITGNNSQALERINLALASSDLLEIGQLLTQTQHKLSSALDVVNNELIEDETTLEILTDNYNNIRYTIQSLIPAANYNIHSSVLAWKEAAQIANISKIFISSSLLGKEINNIFADNSTNSLYKFFNHTESNISYPHSNDRVFLNPAYDTDSFGSSITARIKAGFLEENYNQNAVCSYAYDAKSNSFISYDNELSIIMKSCYVIYTGLGGLVFSDLSSDKSNQLVNLAIDVREDYASYCISNYSSETYPGPYDFSFENIANLIEATEIAKLIGLDN
jgi:hypothetical protein